MCSRLNAASASCTVWAHVASSATAPAASATRATSWLVTAYDSASTRYFSWIDTDPRRSRYDVQVALKRARVTVLGMGGTGGAVAMGLVAAGVGRLHCLDFDDVEVSNLNRQVLYTEDDIGRPKVDTAVRRITAVRPAWTGSAPGGRWQGSVQVRAHGTPLPAELTVSDAGLELVLAEATTGVAPGQAAVLYEDSRVVGSATIAATGS